MLIVPLDQIHVRPDRLRREFPPEEASKLAASIMAQGLLHPPVVDRENFVLVGDRRYRAISALAELGCTFMCGGQVIQPGDIPINRFHSEDPIVKLSAEIEENTVRRDLTWQEKAEGTRRLLELQALRKQQIVPEPNYEPTATEVREVAAEIAATEVAQLSRAQVEDVKRDLLVSAWLAAGPDEEVAKAATRKDALKLIEARLEDQHRLAVAKEFRLRAHDEDHTLIQGDSNLILPTLPSGTFDVILTDPPYGINVDQYADNFQGSVNHHYDDSPQVLRQLLLTIAHEGYRITKPKAHLYFFCDFTQFHKISIELMAAGWDVWPRPMIWHRSDSTGILPRSEHGPRRNYECIVYAIKGNKRVNFVGNDVLSIPSERNAGTAARKPVALYEELLKRSAIVGDRVIDPCAGSGPIFEAATKLEMLATGIELSEALYGVCASKLARKS
jgi:site-specific DNA-methyltransferase (adenine-specific)